MTALGNNPIREVKVALRREVLERLARITPAERMTASQAMRARLLDQAVWRQARAVAMFVPMAVEPDIAPLFQAALRDGKLLCLPRYDPLKMEYEFHAVSDPGRELQPGYRGIPEPADGCPIFSRIRLDLVLVPGVAFDVAGRRLGRGKGFYDRLLRPVNGIKCGVAFEPQMVEAVPVEPHDTQLDCILTPVRWLVAGGGPV